MKTSTLFIILTTLTSLPSAWAGKEAGNGGMVVVCGSGTNRTVEFLDLFEAKHDPAMLRTVPRSDDELDAQVERAVKRLSDGGEGLDGFDRLETALREELKREKFIPLLKGDRLVPIPDAHPHVTRDGCGFKQLANYFADGRVAYDPDLYALMDNTSRAAFKVHEALYALARTCGQGPDETGQEVDDPVTNSDRVRRLVGDLFSSDATNEQIQTDSYAINTDPIPNACHESE